MADDPLDRIDGPYEPTWASLSTHEVPAWAPRGDEAGNTCAEYDAFVGAFTAEAFDPERWARLFDDVGARYVAEMHAKLRELFEAHRPDLLWLDGDWTADAERWGTEVAVNDRLGRTRWKDDGPTRGTSPPRSTSPTTATTPATRTSSGSGGSADPPSESGSGLLEPLCRLPLTSSPGG